MTPPASAARRGGSPMSLRLMADAADHGATLKAQPSVAAKITAGFYRMLADMYPNEDVLARYREAQDAPEDAA